MRRRDTARESLADLDPDVLRARTKDASAEALEGLAASLADRKVVLLGEATHGTSEFYTLRAHLTRQLLVEHDFAFVGVEGDWPACKQVDAFVRDSSQEPATGGEEPREAAAMLAEAYDRWPTWMWANWETAAFASWLRRHNRTRSRKAGFYGLDVYSLHASLDIVLEYLHEHRPESVDVARRAFRCFEPYRWSGSDHPDPRLVPEGCEDEVVAILQALRAEGADGAARFDAEQNARVALNAERYYRATLRGGPDSWNVRDRHMQETLEHLLEEHGPDAKAVVWAHNTHIGDARYTDMEAAGMTNLGRLARERFGRDRVALVGFGTYRGSVIAGGHWGAPFDAVDVPPAIRGSWEDAFHRAERPRALLISDAVREEDPFTEAHGHRAIGVVYRPAHERYGNYVPTVLPDRYDAFVHLDRTAALHPIRGPEGAAAGPPELYPWGF